MSKKVKAYEAIKTLSRHQAAKERAVAAERVDGRKARVSKKAKERAQTVELMKKTLISYPKDAKIAEYESHRTDGGRKGDKQLNAKGRAMARKGGKGVKSAAAQLRRAERIETRKQAQAAKKELREARKAERKAAQLEKRRLAKMPAVKPTQEMFDNVMQVVRGQYKITDKRAARLEQNVLARFAEFPVKRQRNKAKELGLRFALLQAYLMEVDAVLAKVKVPEDKPVGSITRLAKAVRADIEKGASMTVVEAFDEDVDPKKVARVSKDRKAAFGAQMALANKVVVRDEPRPAPKASAGKPLTKKNGKK